MLKDISLLMSFSGIFLGGKTSDLILGGIKNFVLLLVTHVARSQLTWFPTAVCLDGTFGLDCSLSCEDCMNGGRCQEGKSGCLCPAGWTGLICNESNILRTGEDQQAPMGEFSSIKAP